MDSNLRSMLQELGISQVDFAKLIDVSPRAVTNWLNGERSLPGPVIAYANLLTSVPMAIRQSELARVQGRKAPMREGMYLINYGVKAAPQNAGINEGSATLAFEGGSVYGAEWGGAR